MSLESSTVLRRAPDLQVHIDSTGDLQISVRGHQVGCGPHGLAVLDAFAGPSTLADVAEGLKTRVHGVQDWIQLMGTIQILYQAGVLQDEARSSPTFSPGGFGAAPIHAAMLNDKVRTSAFLEGIREVVRPGDVVVDIGTGTGVLAVAAAQAGARHVYAVEASSIGKVAQAVFEANGLADRITLIEGWSTRINLPERADVLVSEIIGHDPLSESVLAVTADALKRLLKPDARLVPNGIKVFGLPVTLPQGELMRHTFTAEGLCDWRAWYGIDFSPLAEVARMSPQALYIKPQLAQAWKTLSEPILLADVDFKTVRHLLIDNTVQAEASAAGEMNAVLVYFDLELGSTSCLSTHPRSVDKNNHWKSPAWTLPTPVPLQVGEPFDVHYTFGVPGTQPGQVNVSRR